jgi:hypothetical protein
MPKRVRVLSRFCSRGVYLYKMAPVARIQIAPPFKIFKSMFISFGVSRDSAVGIATGYGLDD